VIARLSQSSKSVENEWIVDDKPSQLPRAKRKDAVPLLSKQVRGENTIAR
jgi:hypothetical protein